MMGIFSIIAAIIVETIVLWLSQKIVLPSEKEKSIISVLGLVIVGVIATAILTLLPAIGWLLSIIAWIALIKVWFDIDWLRAILIAILAIIIAAIIGALLGGSLAGLLIWKLL